jgi:hypothetical protein
MTANTKNRNFIKASVTTATTINQKEKENAF